MADDRGLTAYVRVPTLAADKSLIQALVTADAYMPAAVDTLRVLFDGELGVAGAAFLAHASEHAHDLTPRQRTELAHALADLPAPVRRSSDAFTLSTRCAEQVGRAFKRELKRFLGTLRHDDAAAHVSGDDIQRISAVCAAAYRRGILKGANPDETALLQVRHHVVKTLALESDAHTERALLAITSPDTVEALTADFGEGRWRRKHLRFDVARWMGFWDFLLSDERSSTRVHSTETGIVGQLCPDGNIDLGAKLGAFLLTERMQANGLLD